MFLLLKKEHPDVFAFFFEKLVWRTWLRLKFQVIFMLVFLCSFFFKLKSRLFTHFYWFSVALERFSFWTHAEIKKKKFTSRVKFQRLKTTIIYVTHTCNSLPIYYNIFGKSTYHEKNILFTRNFIQKLKMIRLCLFVCPFDLSLSTILSWSTFSFRIEQNKT